MHAQAQSPPTTDFETRVGHPPGLFVLFFAEMWERFSYYGMRALLVFYMMKGFLAYDDKRAYAVYGAYTALVYATPFIGGMLADQWKDFYTVPASLPSTACRPQLALSALHGLSVTLRVGGGGNDASSPSANKKPRHRKRHRGAWPSSLFSGIFNVARNPVQIATALSIRRLPPQVKSAAHRPYLQAPRCGFQRVCPVSS